MKICAAVALVVIVGLVASSYALPAKKRMVYYQQPQSWYSAPQRLMYLQYQQVHPSKTHARSTQAAAALVSGDAVATGTYLKDCHHPEDGVAAEDALKAAAANGAQSVAEAYPAPAQADFEGNDGISYTYDQPTQSGEPAAENVPAQAGFVGAAEEEQDTDAKAPRDYNFDKAAEAENEAAADAAAADAAAAEAAQESDAVAPAEAEVPAPESPTAPVEQPAVAPVAPVAAVPANRYLPAKKKVYVELEQEQEDEEEDDSSVAEYDAVPEERPARVPNARRPTKANQAPAKGPSKAKAPLPAGTFFPIDFGGTAGGAIAIANSFSTGEGGSATSHAIAYGSPEAARARVRPSKFH